MAELNPAQHPPRSPPALSALCLDSLAEARLRLLVLPSHRNEQQINAGLINDDWELLMGVWEGSPASHSQDEYGFSCARDCECF